MTAIYYTSMLAAFGVFTDMLYRMANHNVKSNLAKGDTNGDIE